MISMIAVIGKNRELGKSGGLCFSLKEDMKFFRETTMGHKVVMGSKTLESLPGGALKGRENFVLTRRAVDFPNVTEIHSLEEAVEMFSETSEEVFVIGGASIYAQFLPYASVLYLTEVEASAEADAYFPEFDKRLYRREVLKTGEGVDRMAEAREGLSRGGGPETGSGARGGAGKKLKFSFVKYTKKECL